MKHSTKLLKNKKRKTLRRIYGGAEKRKAEQTNNGGAEPNGNGARSEGFYSALLKKRKWNQNNATRILAQKVKDKRRNTLLQGLMSPTQQGTIRSENRLPYFGLANTIIKRIFMSNPTDVDVNIYASRITEDIAPKLEELLKYNNDTYNSELLKFMRLHNLSTLR